jgi:hypothetical protein
VDITGRGHHCGGSFMAPAHANGPARDLTGMCGTDMNAAVQRMQAGGLTGTRATECWCFFWERGGSKPIRMFNGKQAADVCAPTSPRAPESRLHRHTQRPATQLPAAFFTACPQVIHRPRQLAEPRQPTPSFFCRLEEEVVY